MEQTTEWNELIEVAENIETALGDALLDMAEADDSETVSYSSWSKTAFTRERNEQ